MLKNLRQTFILLNMVTVAIVVIGAFSVIGVLSYQSNMNSIYNTLRLSIEEAAQESRDTTARQFTAPDFLNFLDGGTGSSSSSGSGTGSSSSSESGSSANSGSNANSNSNSSNKSYGTDDNKNKNSNNNANSSSNSSEDSANNSSNDQSYTQPEIGNAGKNSIPIAVYKEKAAGIYTHVSAASSASLSGTDYIDAFAQLQNDSNTQGILNTQGLIFVKENISGTTYCAFTSTASTASWKNMVFLLCCIAIATLIVFFIISLFFSKWALQPVEVAWTKQHQFLADASHELKTPLTVILANTDIMLDHASDTIENQKQWLVNTKKEAENMHELVVSMLDLAKMEAQSDNVVTPASNMQFDDIDFSDVVFSSTLQFESRAFEESVEIEENIAEEIHVMGSVQPLERLCGTLLDNACKYAEPDSTVNVKLEKLDAITLKNMAHTTYEGNMPKGRVAVLSVHNAGPAIDEVDLEHVFDRFYRSDKARTHSDANNSYGLGLAIAANAVGAHKGCIMATSAEGCGTTFRVVLPLAK